MTDQEPATLRRVPLNVGERRRAVLVGLIPIALALLILVPMSLLGPATIGEALIAAAVYGGLGGLAAGFVYVDRAQARQCPRCSHRRQRGDATCEGCGYDLATQPRYACSERHEVYVEPGLCHCGRRLVGLDAPRGIAREIVTMLKVGAWLLAFLLGVGFILNLVG